MSDFDFLDSYGESEAVANEEQLPENEAASALNAAFVGIGGGGGKLAKAFLDLGFNKTLLINTTDKDLPEGVDAKHVVIVPDADGVGKNVEFGKKIMERNGAVVEDALRTKLGKVDWIFVCAGGGGGTGSAAVSLQPVFERYLQSVEAEGKAVYFVTTPNQQEQLNDTIKKNSQSLLKDVKDLPHLVLSNEKQVQLLRGKVGMLGMFPVANSTYAKLFWQILKLSSEPSQIQTFDSKDLSRCLKPDKRMFLGSTIVADPKVPNLGATIYQNCIKRSPCPLPSGKPKTGAMLLVVTPEMANDPEISKHLDAAISYVGGRTETLFSGVYLREDLPGLVAILSMNGLEGE